MGFSMLQIYRKISRSLGEAWKHENSKKTMILNSMHCLLRNCWRQLVPTSVITENMEVDT